MWLINNRSVFLTVLEIRKSKIKVTGDLMSGESPLSGSLEPSSGVGKSLGESCVVSFIRVLILH